MLSSSMVYLKPYTELGLVVHALSTYRDGEGASSAAYATAKDVWQQFPEIKVHKDLEASDVKGFIPMLHELEEPVGVPFPDEELWYVHGVMDWYAHFVRQGCWLTRGVFEQLTNSVAELDTPPY